MASAAKLGMLTAGIDPLAAMLPVAASSSKPAREPWEGNGWLLQLRKVSELSIDPKRSRLCTRNKRRCAFVRLSCFEIIEAEVKKKSENGETILHF